MKANLFTALLIFMVINVFCQRVGIGTTLPHASAVLEINSTSGGMLLPRMTTAQRNAIAAPSEGLLVFDTDVKTAMQFANGSWQSMSASAISDPAFARNGNIVYSPGSETKTLIWGNDYLPLSGDFSFNRHVFLVNSSKKFIRGGHTIDGTNFSTDRSGMYSIAFGYNTLAPGLASYAFGTNVKAMADNSMAIGFGAYAGNETEIAIGRYNDTTNNIQIFSIGHGFDESSRSNVMNALTNGRIGMGTNTPQTKLHVSYPGGGGAGQIIVEEQGDPADGARITFKNDARNDRYWDLYGLTNNLNDNARFNFFYSGYGDVMNLNANGRVGIGVSTALATLHVRSGSSTTLPQAHLQVTQDSYTRLRMSNATNATPYWDIAGLTHASTPTNAQMNFFYTQTGGVGIDVISLRGNGNAVLAGTLTQNSDARLKKDMVHIDNVLPLLQELNGYHYKWKDDRRDQEVQTGLLAQEVEKVMPELVKEDDKGIKSVNYNGLLPYLIEAVKTLHAQNREMAARMAELERRNK